MELTFVDGVFFVYTFLSLYMLSLMCFIYFFSKDKLFYYPPAKIEPVSIVVPCYNESESIGKTIESLLKLNYPKDMIEIIVVDDMSKDNSVEVIRRYEKKYSNVRLIVNSRNSGGAAEPTNIGINSSKYNYIAVTDADSFPDKDNLLKMIGFLQQNDNVAGVTCRVLASKPKNFMQGLQEIEYEVIAFSRKLLDSIDSVYVTPGPFALYKKDALKKVGLFDIKNMTQDIEIVWRLLSKGYKVRMSLPAKVYSNTPTKFKQWFRQRVRWNIGGTQTLVKYKEYILKRGMLGSFIIPYFSLNLFIGLFGLGLFLYLVTRRLLLSYLTTKYSLYGNATILRLQELSFSPSILNFFGIILFILGVLFTLFSLSMIKEEFGDRKNIFNLLFYLVVYLAIYPIVMMVALTKYITGKYSW